MVRRSASLLLLPALAASIACTGSQGPPGPQGERGLQGDIGPAGTFSGTFNGGAVFNGSVTLTPLATVPAGPVDGTVYMDSQSMSLQLFQGGEWYELVKRPPRTVAGFTGNLGPDLSREGFTQCHGWLNDGAVPAPTYTAIRDACGAGTELVFAGYRAGEPTLVRHDVFLAQPFSSFLPVPQPTSTTFYNNFDPEGRFTWAIDTSYILLAVRGNTWVDPGRLWEVAVAGQTTAGSGHVLSQEGGNTNDQATRTGDRYFIYIRR